MDESSLIVIVMPIVIPVALFTGIALRFIAGSRSGRSPAEGWLARPNALKRISAAGRKARAAKPGANDTAPAEYLYVPCARSRYHHGQSTQTRRWVQGVPIVKKTAKLIYYTSDTWNRREAVVSPGCISREQFETDTRCHGYCPRDIAAGLVCAPHGRGHRHCVHFLAPGRHCHAPGGCGEDCPGRHPRRAVRKTRVHVGALPTRRASVPSRIPGRVIPVPGDRHRPGPAGRLFFATRQAAEDELDRAERGQAEQGARQAPPIRQLRRAMADAHPDRGGTAEQFIQARRRYQTALRPGPAA